MTARKAAPRANTATAQSKRIAELEDRLKIVEDIVGAAKRKQQRAAAEKLAQNPEQLNALRELLALADDTGAQ